MAVQKGKSATRAKNKYNAQNYDNIRVVVPKGQKSNIMTVAESAGDSLNGFISKAIEEYTINYRRSLKKVYTIIGGVNGTGKSSFTGANKYDNINSGVIIDVDKITALNKVFPIEGGKIAIDCINNCLEEGLSFTQETTLAGHKTENTAARARELGYFICLNYIGLDTPEECLKRIYNRVARGGHSIGEVDVRRRFAERWIAVKRILPFCDEAAFYDNDNGFVKVAELHDKTLILTEEKHPTWIIELSDYLKRNKL